MKCPLKFARYEFEGGEDCVGAECGFYGAVCRNDDSEPKSDVSAADADANDGNADTREKLEAEILDAGCADEIDYDRIIGWLDRQVAITERKHLELTCAFQLESDKRIIELQAKVDELTIQLRASNAERERLRECLGIATDNAHDLLTLVDESGNVYDRDEGLA